MVERGVEGPGKGWLSHDQIFQYSWKIFLATSRVLNFCNKYSKYIGKFGHVTTSLCQGLYPPHASLQKGPGNEVVLLLIYGGSSTRKAGRGSEAKRRPTLQMLIQIAKLIFFGEQPRIPKKLKQQTLMT